jgi:integrase
VADWIAVVSAQVDPLTKGLYELHMRVHLGPHFKSLDGITTGSIAEYGRNRLAVVKRATLQKERSTLRGFLDWCAERGHLESVPEFPPLPRKAAGTPHPQRRRGVATDLSPEECLTVIEALPQWSTPRAGRPAFPVRARFVVMYETALRPATLDALSVPEHWTRGQDSLLITDAIDKARFGRTLPLSTRAMAALASVVRGKGLIFGKHDYRPQLVKASKGLAAQKRATFTAYDFRHARITELAETGNLTGTQYMAGHKRVSTTAIYTRPGLKAAKRVLASVGPSHITKLSDVQVEPITQVFQSGAKERTRTSTGVTPLAPQGIGVDSYQFNSDPLVALAAEAVELRRTALTDEYVDKSRVIALARAAIELTELGALALQVLDGGIFAPGRALKLALQIIAMADAAKAQNRRKGDR